MKFSAVTPDSETIGLIINIEIQNENNVPVDIIAKSAEISVSETEISSKNIITSKKEQRASFLKLVVLFYRLV